MHLETRIFLDLTSDMLSMFRHVFFSGKKTNIFVAQEMKKWSYRNNDSVMYIEIEIPSYPSISILPFFCNNWPSDI